jgi:hypothetical protein
VGQCLDERLLVVEGRDAEGGEVVDAFAEPGRDVLGLTER